MFERKDFSNHEPSLEGLAPLYDYIDEANKEIERLHSLFERAVEHIEEHEQCYPTPNQMTQWLKDAAHLELCEKSDK